MPSLLLFAGPNGSGKTTVARKLFDDFNGERINADDIAAGLKIVHGGTLADHALKAVQLSDQRVMEAISGGRSFAVETVLSSSKFQKMLSAARSAGYAITTVFVYLRHPQMNVFRVEQRVRLGGHWVPADKVLERHPKSLRNLEWCSGMSDVTLVYENDRDAYPVLVASRDRDGWFAHNRQGFEDFAAAVRPLWSQLGYAALGA